MSYALLDSVYSSTPLDTCILWNKCVAGSGRARPQSNLHAGNWFRKSSTLYFKNPRYVRCWESSLICKFDSAVFNCCNSYSDLRYSRVCFIFSNNISRKAKNRYNFVINPIELIRDIVWIYYATLSGTINYRYIMNCHCFRWLSCVFQYCV